jgi:hypothetical protein
MPGWAKALLIILAVVVVLVVGAVVIGVVYVAGHKDAWRARGKELVAEGRDFGTHSDNQGCVDEMMARYKKEPGFLSTFATQAFVKGCFETSRPTPGFCENIPLGDLSKMLEWREAQCRHYGLATDLSCRQLLTSVVIFCGEQKRKER